MVKVNNYKTQNAGKGIHRFFDVYRLPTAVAYIENILEAATLPTVWKHEAPANVLCFMENMEQLFTAVYPWHNNYKTSDEAITLACVSGSVSSGCITDSRNGHQWNHFPRSLTARQYSHPYNAIRQCCAYLKESAWRQLLHDITQFTLSDTSLYDMQPQCNILRVRRHLLQLVESCHLIGANSGDITAINKGQVKKRNV